MAEISYIIQERLRDPRIGFVTITDVEVSKDLRHAKAFVSVLGDSKQRRETMDGLASASPFIRSEIAQRVRLRYVPEIVFGFDPGIERGARIFQLMNELNIGSTDEDKTTPIVPEADSD